MFMEKIWYGKSPVAWLLWPLSCLYRGITILRRWYLERFFQKQPSVPLIVVGNLSVGGVGKTPLVIAIAKAMRAKGLKVGIVSRGYGSKINKTPYEVQLRDTAQLVGDEPLLIAQKTLCPVVIAPKRMEAVDYLIKQHQVELIISDDGLQHYRMGRSIEIAVIDGQRGLGNAFCLPAGPLRESEKRLREVDFIIATEGFWPKAHSMHLAPGNIRQLNTDEPIGIDALTKPIVALAAIGNPQRFYSTLQQLEIEFRAYSYPDHYQFKSRDVEHPDSMVVMTEKDAVKCSSFSFNNLYYLPVEAVLGDAFWDALWSHQQLQGYA